MPRLHTSKQFYKVLKRAGFVKVSQKGSHVKFKGIWEGKLQTVIVPDHKQIAKGTFSSILRQASMSRDEFERLL